MFVLGLAFLYYLWWRQPRLWTAQNESVLLALAILLFLLVARITVPAHTVLPYIFPYSALTMILAVLLGLDVALVTTVFFVLLIGWLTGGSLELMTYAFCGALVGALNLRRGDHLSGYPWAAAYIAGTGVLIVGAFRLVAGELDTRGLVELTSAAVVNGLVAMTVTLVGVYLTGVFLRITTPLQLLDLARPTHPLLRQLLLKAPGTYHHTLLVSNMAERAAEAIGADGQLARVGAYYHDVGKTIRPYFFVENRSEGLDPHARLDPYTSAQIIISHVTDGIELARKYRLPRRIIEFIPEHHGTLLVHYFYHQAVQAAGSPDKVDRAQFLYLGPKPQSRETAITMLADGAEATVRAKRPATMEELAQVIAESVQSRANAGQLDECELSLSDLYEIKQAFFDVLRGLQHPRITYPAELPAGEAPAQVPAQAPEPEAGQIPAS
jgi:putative nucleotidyltransferase with HDIG domain